MASDAFLMRDEFDEILEREFDNAADYKRLYNNLLEALIINLIPVPAHGRPAWMGEVPGANDEAEAVAMLDDIDEEDAFHAVMEQIGHQYVPQGAPAPAAPSAPPAVLAPAMGTVGWNIGRIRRIEAERDDEYGIGFGDADDKLYGYPIRAWPPNMYRIWKDPTGHPNMQERFLLFVFLLGNGYGNADQIARQMLLRWAGLFDDSARRHIDHTLRKQFMMPSQYRTMESLKDYKVFYYDLIKKVQMYLNGTVKTERGF